MKTAKKYRNYKSSKDLPAMCRAIDVASYLGINITKAYELFKRNDFKSLKIGNRYLITKEELIKWINIHSNK